jgi:signal transduction histidine kinase
VDYITLPVSPLVLKAKVGVFVDLYLKTRLLREKSEEVHRMRERESRRELDEARSALGELESRLVRVKKMEALGLLAGGLAHEFNNLMTGVLGHAHLALGTLEAGHPVRDHLDQVIECGERAAQLTGQLLSFGQKQILAPKAVDLNGLAQEAMERMKRHAWGARIGYEPAPEGPRILVDPEKFRDALECLVQKAVESMPREGSIQLRTFSVRQGRAPEGGAEWAVLEIEDSGTGMDPEALERCFDPFQSGLEPGKGGGLDMPAVHGFILQSGGRVQVSSAPGIGTRFRLLFPRVRRPREGR